MGDNQESKRSRSDCTRGFDTLVVVQFAVIEDKPPTLATRVHIFFPIALLGKPGSFTGSTGLVIHAFMGIIGLILSRCFNGRGHSLGRFGLRFGRLWLGLGRLWLGLGRLWLGLGRFRLGLGRFRLGLGRFGLGLGRFGRS